MDYCANSAEITCIIPPMSSQTLRALLISMRPKQWLKNVLIFTALVFDEKLLDPQALLATFFGFFIFCLISSSVYLLNDITDVGPMRKVIGLMTIILFIVIFIPRPF